MSKETRKPTINGRTYYIVGEETSKYRRVSVYNDDKSSVNRPNRSDIVYEKKYKNRIFGLMQYDPPSLDEMMKDALSEAIEIRRVREEDKEEKEEKIDEKIDRIKELYEEEYGD